MAQLRAAEDKENWKKLFLPSTSELKDDDNNKAYVVMDTGPLVTADTLDIAPDSPLMKTTTIMLTRRIKEWNFEDINGRLPIILDNVVRMEIEDIQFLSRQIDASDRTLTDDQKKTSISTSPAPINQTTSTTIPVTQSQ